MASDPQRESAGVLPALVALGLLVLLLVATVLLYRPPPAEPIDAPETVFSGERALQVLRELTAGQGPRPVGSAANVRFRNAVLGRFESLGYETELQEDFTCGPGGHCLAVGNVLAWRPGQEQGQAVLLVAHHDTVAAGPGAGDDSSGVAILLEVARLLASGPRTRHPILFLITDGEEVGLNGTQLFLSDLPWASRVGAVINLEARGTGGSSVMFESGPGNAGVIRLLAASVRRPVASSFTELLYRLMPHGTDFYLFKVRGLPGLNFAFTGHPLRYHTREERLEHLDPRSLQHQGEAVLAAARALAATDLARLPQGDAVFFNLFGRTLLWWPDTWNWPIAGLALLLLALAAGRWWRTGSLRPIHLLWGLGGLIVVPVLAWVGASVMESLARRSSASPGLWVAEPLPLMTAFWLLAVAIAIPPAIVAARRVNRTGLWAGVWLAWALIALLLAAAAPGAAYLFSVPALVASLAVVSRLRTGRSLGPVAATLPTLFAALLWFPEVWFFYEAMGLPIMPAVTALVALLLWGLAPGFPRSRRRGLWGLPAAAGAASLLCLGLAMARPPFTPDQPQSVNLLHVQDADTGDARWAADIYHGPLPAELVQAADFSRDRKSVV